MSNDKQRRFPFVLLDPATLTAMVRPVFPGQQVLLAQPLTDGYVNTNYKLTLSDHAEPVVLRIYVRLPRSTTSTRSCMPITTERIS
jgi:hypothetical protein